ncbi:MAG: DUF1573 domain-containing protein [Flavobacteriaceae bacterium]|nr:DUF1573 domain-containing protein [Flavobacteriaceae bacterium]
MKKIILSIVVLFVGITSFSAQTISFENVTIDYGTVKKGENGKKVFEFTNTGNLPLIISNVKTSCGCTVPSWTKTPILPDKKGNITVQYDTKITGKFSKSIEVFSNDPKAARKVLTIKGEIQ